jgi:hypothetical protein
MTSITWQSRKGGTPHFERRNVWFKCEQYPFPVMHCMHPTANFPWYTYTLDGELRTFRLLKQAKQWVIDMVTAQGAEVDGRLVADLQMIGRARPRY